jgi:hypothetical protein
MLNPSNVGETWLVADETCPKCNMIYSVTVTRLASPETDSFNCLVCGHRIGVWEDSTERYNYTVKPDDDDPQHGGS